MNKKSSASSSSTGTANSKAYDEIARLGERIVASLSKQNGRRRDHDPLTRWMAHEIAGAMTAVKKARSAKARRDVVTYASELILKVWAARQRWPEGWPPKSARERMSRLETGPQFGQIERETAEAPGLIASANYMTSESKSSRSGGWWGCLSEVLTTFVMHSMAFPLKCKKEPISSPSDWNSSCTSRRRPGQPITAAGQRTLGKQPRGS